MRQNRRWTRLSQFVDLIELRYGDTVDFFARNPMGLHVPITTLSKQDLERAVLWSLNVGAD